jgi:hypothetical protein
VETTKEKCKNESLASLSPSLAWFLLTASEHQLILDYLAKVLEQNTEQEVQQEQEERQLTLVKG